MPLHLLLALGVVGAVFSPAMDSEIAELHATIEELWQRLGTLADEMQAAGKFPNAQKKPQEEQVSLEVVENIGRLQEEFVQLQQQAYQIGEDSADNEALARHPLVDSYVQSLRAFQPRLKNSVVNLEKEYRRVKPVDHVKRKEELRREKFCGSSLATLRAKAKKRLARDTRSFKTKAIDELTIFRERQLEMQDKQRDMLERMEGPDWPRLDWPLTNADARHVGDAEDLIHSGVNALKSRLAPKDIPFLHESGDEEALEALVATSDMMVCYSKLMDRYVEKVKKSQKAKKESANVEVRNSLLNFGQSDPKPFAWLRNNEGRGDPPDPPRGDPPDPRGDPPDPPGTTEASEPPVSSLSGLAQLGSSLGGLTSPPVDTVDMRWSAAQPVYNDLEL